jgi:Ca2+-binding EF-hand superfamily protein
MEHVLYVQKNTPLTLVQNDQDAKTKTGQTNQEKLSSSIHIRHYPIANGHSKGRINGWRSDSSNATSSSKVQNTSNLRIKAIQPNDSTKELKKIDTIAINHIMHENRIKKNGFVGSKRTRGSPIFIRNIWKRRHARSIQEGIRREHIESNHKELGEEQSTTMKLTNLLLQQNTGSNNTNASTMTSSKKKYKRNYVARTIAGLISALAEEATGLEVHVDTRNDTPLWRKQIDCVKIQFSRLGFKPLRMGALDEALNEMSGELSPSLKEIVVDRLESKAGQSQYGLDRISLSKTADEVFEQIDTDNSGSLDSEELVRALSIASGLPAVDSHQTDKDQSSSALSHLTTQLVDLYDMNGDGVIDREEYRRLVEDMTEIRNAQRMKKLEKIDRKEGGIRILRWTRIIQNALSGLWIGKTTRQSVQDMEKIDTIDSSPLDIQMNNRDVSQSIDFEHAENISDASIMNTVYNGEGSIYFSGLKLDLRQLLFGVFPLIKRITPGGPLILEPFNMTLTGSFNKKDILESALLDDGLRRLVARALRRRVRTLRDLVDGAVFYGRTWKDLGMKSKQAPIVEVPALTDIEFEGDKLIITGKTRVRAAPSQPFVENSFKLRTKLGTRENGQYIRLLEPEIAVVLECPRSWERSIVAACKTFNLPIPTKPSPIYQFIPLVSPIQKTEQDGFNLGEDNRIKSIFIKDNALRFEISAVLRPGRFLGNHYLAFTVPNRTFIITMDRIREGIRVARQNKRELQGQEREKEMSKNQEATIRYNRAVAQALSKSEDVQDTLDSDLSYKKKLDDSLSFIEPKEDRTEEENVIVPNRPGFIGRFLEGYLEAAREETERERNERLTTAISEFFGSDEETTESD